jgi:hypothetical protein
LFIHPSLAMHRLRTSAHQRSARILIAETLERLVAAS